MLTLLAKILAFSVRHRWLVVVLTLAVGALGVYNFNRLPIDAVPDITNVQVQINTSVKALSPVEVERRVTFPIEWAMGGIPSVEQVRSLSRYGLSQVTVIFKDGTDIFWARQLVGERLAAAKESLPPGLGEPQMGPIATGLGEIYMWTLEASPEARRPDGKPYELTDLRTIQDWIVRPQLRTVPGVTEINSIGGYEQLYQVSPDPAKLVGYGLSFRDVLEAVARNNANAGGGYIEHKGEQYLIRATGLVQGEDDIRRILVGHHDGVPIRVGDVAEVGVGRELRTGAATEDGREVVIGTAIMLVGENSRSVSQRVSERMQSVNKSLPEGVTAKTVYDRTYLVEATLSTVQRSLLEGAALVVVVLFLLLGNVRAALIAALAIPFSMLIAITGMVEAKISGNLMSLGAIDFGLIVDGSVIIVENCVRRFAEEQHRLGRVLTRDERIELAYEASQEVRKATIFGEIIIAIVYLPILTLTGIEGKMFRPMAETVVLALAGATILSMTFIPALVALLLTGKVSEKENFLFRHAKRGYEQIIGWALAHRSAVVIGATALLAVSGLVATRLGSEFAPKLSEGALALQPARIPSIGITTSVEMQMQLERVLKERFPDEIEHIFARTGTAEVATDPMGPNVSDTYLMLKPRSGWKKAKTQEELAEAIEEVIKDLPGQNYEFSQPIELRFNELISGVRSDVAVKVFGDDLDVMLKQAQKIGGILGKTPGAADVKVEQVTGLPVLTIDVDRDAAARYGLNIADVHAVIEAAVGGISAGEVFEGDKRFDLVIRLPDAIRGDIRALQNLPVPLPEADRPEAATRTVSATDRPEQHAAFVPLGSVAKIAVEEGPNQVSRENGKRRVVVQANVRGRDLGSFVADAQQRIDAEVKLPAGYWTAWGGQFENLIAARQRLALVVPVALGLIFGLLFLSFGTLKNALLIFTGVPLALTGGIFALWIRGLPVSISAAIGFIALSGVAVLNGLVMVTFIENMRQQGESLDDAVFHGSIARLRPVLMTALVAALGFVPMALATGTGSEVQRPLATVVIGGILSSTALTLLILPTLYRLFHAREATAAPAPPLAERIIERGDPPA
ncbi:efflux RND transporter permease subunit [Sorangium atrum]|uniref:CusA/CzcA family heavy metal efflux RND transporter n=1 Tax=Sorangium atrum TaxID=2995308 RepID=A0ABT5CDE9_9BACT|nr:CusA/CzcA family heavy metal efflux RND transporter [Sorangium aterium]MDC0684463.1 CusA/CzcA family heavy metal efflux RND transporter [Sorangium aterium]